MYAFAGVLSPEILNPLHDVRKHYAARSPSVPSLLVLPSRSKLALREVQDWLVTYLLVSDDDLLHLLKQQDDTNEVIALGAVPWRRSFWKRIVREIEQGMEETTFNEVGSKRL